MKPCLAAIFALVLLVLGTAPALAQDTSPRSVEVDELERLVSTIEDQKGRAQLVGQLRGLIAAQRAQEVQDGLGQDLLDLISDRTQSFGRQIAAGADALADLPRLLDWVAQQARDPLVRDRWVEALIKLAILLTAGLAAQWLVDRVLRKARAATRPPRDDLTPLARTPLEAARVLIGLVPLAAFGLAAYGALTLLETKEVTTLAAVLIMSAYLLTRSVIVLAEALLSPHEPALRLLTIGDETAGYLLIWVRRLTHVSVFGWFGAKALRLLGLPAAGHLLLLKALGLLVTAMLVMLILQNRQTVREWIRGLGRPGARLAVLRNRLADIWHVLAAAYIAVAFAVWALQIKGGFDYLMRASALTLVILTVASIASAAIRRGVERAFTVGDELKTRLPHLEARANRYLSVLQVVLRAAVAVATGLALMQAWGIDALGWLSSDLGRRIIGSLASIAMIVLVALLAWEAVSSSIERYLAQVDGDGNPIERSARARTLLPLLRNALMVLLVGVVGLMVLSELGVNIAPLLAGAGVVGVAVGFGSQKLVQDVITGVFILLEDTVSVGDVVSLGDHAGVVEAMSIRSIRLRDMTGSVHTIPFSTVGTVKNMTKEFSYYVFDVGVAYREDTDHVTAVLKEVGESMRADPEFGRFMVEPLEVLGVDKFADSGVILKARVKTQPIKQWIVGREFNRRIKKRFDELGIEMPFPQRTLHFGEDRQGRAAPMRVRLEPEQATPPGAPVVGPEHPAPVDLPTRRDLERAEDDSDEAR
ncbi:MAG: mechanosensitive ion channel [Alphaproteobacteria bacterium]|nr:mechanosensitive ion channel [Alphaproteobacteria bacterium]